MANFENIAKKAFYLGVGFASYAQEKANDTIKELRVQAQKLAKEMVERGEMNAEEARKFVDDLVKQAQQETAVEQGDRSTDREPRRIEIVDEDEPTAENESPKSNSHGNNDNLRQQVQSLQEELRRLRKEM